MNNVHILSMHVYGGETSQVQMYTDKADNRNIYLIKHSSSKLARQISEAA